MTASRISNAAGRRSEVLISVNGQPVSAYSGESLAAALAAAGILRLRTGPTGSARGAFCFMGACQECAIIIDDAVQQACLIRVKAGMKVELKGAAG